MSLAKFTARSLLSAIFIALKPHLITTFSDADYLRQNTRQIWK